MFPSPCGFRKGHSTLHCLLVLTEKFKETIDASNNFGALLTDLSKHLTVLIISLLVAKLHWYGLSPLSLTLDYIGMDYIGMDFHLYLLSLYSSISAIAPIAPK